MTRMPTYEEIKDDFERGVRTAEQRIEHPFRHAADAATPTPAAQPVNLASATAAAVTPQGATMPSLAILEDDVKADLTDGLNWLQGFASRLSAAAPGIIATSEAVGGSTVGALVEAVAGRVLPPQLEAILANQVRDFVDRYAPAQVAAAPVPAQAPQAAPAQ